MSDFQFRLDSVLRTREAERQRRRRDLAEALRADELLAGQIADLLDELSTIKQHSRTASEPGQIVVEGLLETHRYKLVLTAQSQVLRQKGRQLQAEVERRRQALAEADRDVKVLERLRERQSAEHERRERIKEQNQLDEIVVQRWGSRTPST